MFFSKDSEEMWQILEFSVGSVTVFGYCKR